MNNTNPKNVEFQNNVLSNDKVQFIIESLQKAKILENTKNPVADEMRLLIQDETEDKYTVHFGSIQPETGGSGQTFEINKISGEVIFLETETYAPMPFDVK